MDSGKNATLMPKPLDEDFSYVFLRVQAAWGSVFMYMVQNDLVFRVWEKGTGHYTAHHIPINIP